MIGLAFYAHLLTLVKLTTITLQAAIQASYINFLQWITELFPRHLKFVLDVATTNFHVPVLEWQKGAVDISYFLEGVTCGGSYFTSLLKASGMEGLCYLWKYHPSQFSGPIAAHAVHIGDVAFVHEWLDSSKSPEDYTLALWTAIKESKLEIAKILWDFGVRISDENFPSLVGSVTDLEMLKWVSSVTTYDNEKYQGALHTACRIGSKNMVTWLMEEKGAKLSPHDMQSLVRSENFELLKWAREQGGQWDEGAASAVVEESLPLEMLLWMIEEGCPYDGEELMNTAIDMPKNSEILEWLHESQEIPFSEELFDSLWPTCVENLEYLLQATNHQLTPEEVWDLAEYEPAVMIPFLIRKCGQALGIEFLYLIAQKNDLDALKAIYFGDDPHPLQIWDANTVSLLLYTKSWGVFDWGVAHGVIVDDDAKKLRREVKTKAERKQCVAERNPEFCAAVWPNLKRKVAEWRANARIS